jgi:hypothetical protein
MPLENDQIREEKAALVEIAQEYLDFLRCTARTTACLDTIRRVETVLAWATSSPSRGGTMSQETQGQFVDLSRALARTYGSVTRALSNDEVLTELTARGSSRKDLQELLIALERVGGAFFNDGQPA